ncbi:Siderophore iron transporter mirA [Pestalotiopsis fici W106-1]|uniref:Siderophore iron transporter mirA n=1 Tax=Pestalotiopsis fici (strain W106-1 / CGMCC3.15140) TaxID=1229662 RepID=W3XIQ7_PESFW|nr:Siderophore iron transporter mirA [Pestalotiopsis fici W106-1]ETS85312.1 Siderophore iron transporter mirA [Pestalotiopsis fici W106-1]
MATDKETPEAMVSSSPEDVDPVAKNNEEILKESWSRRSLIIAYTSLFAATFILSFIKYSTKVYDAYATSSFSKHAALTTANVVFGRAEGFALSITTMVLGQVLYAACQDVGTYVAGGIFEAIGDTGYAVMQQIFIADTTNLLNRGLWSSLPESVTAIPTLYLGTIVADQVLAESTWRWGYGMWALILPFCSVPLVVTMYILQRRAKKNGYMKSSLWSAADVENTSLPHRLRQLFVTELDLFGAFLLVVGLGLTLIPLTLTGSKNSDKWQQGSFIAMLVVGIAITIAFFVWDVKFAAKPFVPFRMIRERTVVAACLLSILDFFHYSCFTIFFPSYLQVAGGYSAGHASRIDNALRVTFQISSVLVGLAMKYSKRSQIFVFIGVPLCVLGQGLQIYFTNMHGTHAASEICFITAKTLVGLGRGFYQTAAQVSIQSLVPREDVAVVTGVYFAAMNFGAAIGTSVSGAIWNSLLPAKLTEYLPEEAKPQAQAIYKSITVAKKYAQGTIIRAAIDQAYRETQQRLAIAATAALAPMLLIMFFLKNVDLSVKK